MEHNVLFRTIHGSRLYGLSHENSDYDYYTVVEKVRTNKASYSTHSIVDDLDSTVVDFGTWVNQCQRGVPQALEAMFSTKAEVDKIEAFRAGFVAGNAYNTYLRTMKAMARDNDDFKHKRHLLRLGLNMRDIRAKGRFNPTLDRVEVALINSLARLDMENVYNDALAIAWA